MRRLETLAGKLAHSSCRGLAALWLLAAAPAAADEALATRRDAAVTFLHLADVYAIAPVDGGKAGGLARVAALDRRLAAGGREVLLTLGGDFLSPSVASSVFQGEQMMAVLAAAGLDLATIGNHELDFGPELLRRRMAAASWQWVVSNVRDAATGEPLPGARPYVVRRHGSLKVGYLGLCLAGSGVAADNRRGLTFDDPFEAAASALAALEDEGVDAIVALTHLDYADDVRLARRFPAIDLILGGHDHFPVASLVERTLIVKPGSDARHVVRVDLGRAAPGAPVEKHFELVPVTAGLGEEPETARVVAEWQARLEEQLDVVIGSTAEPLDAVASRVKSGESNLGNLLADAMRRDTGADLAILNSGSIRSNRVYPAGDLTRRDLAAIHPFGGVVCEVAADGRTVRAALEHGVSRLGEGSGRFPQVSGLRLRVDPSRPVGERVREVEVGGAALEPEKTYRLAIGDYLLKGGDGYDMLAGAEVRVNPESGNLLIAALEALIRERGEVAPRLEGRLRLGEGVAPAARRKVILDTDMGIDSVMGMLFLLKSPEVQVAAVTTVHGIADPRPGLKNALRILELTGDAGVPVAAGARRPLRGKRGFPEFWQAQANTLGGARLPAARRRHSKREAADLILDVLAASPEPVTIIAMGPLTNVALALAKSPAAAEGMREIVVMGGALEGPGNVGNPYVGIDNQVAEWNFYLDPHAAERVLAAGVPIRLLTLAATGALPVTPEFVDRVRERPRDETSELLLALLEAVADGIDAGWYYFWDVAAAVAAARPEVMGCRQERIRVITDSGPNLGQTLPAADGAAVCVAEEVNREAFEGYFLESIFR